MDAKHVLVTGAGGFIGINLCESLLARGLRVTGIDVHYPPGLPHCDHENYRQTDGDFRDGETISKLLDDVDAVVHLASAHLDVSLSTSEYWDINVHSLKPLLELCESKSVKRFVHVSSVGVYGALTTLPADEETPLAPQSIYGETKAQGEDVVREFSERTGFPTVIVRPAWVYGPWCPRTSKLYRTLRKGRFLLIGKCDNYRHPVYIKDLNESLHCALDSGDAVGQTMIVGGNDVITTEELIASYCNVFELPFPRVRIPMWTGRLLAAGVELGFRVIGKSPPISRRTLEFFDTNNAFQIDKSVRILGVQPAFDFESGLRDCHDWIVGNA